LGEAGFAHALDEVGEVVAVDHRLRLRGQRFEITDAAGGRWALAISASNQPLLWLALADEITVRLLLEQLHRTDGLQLLHGTDHIEEWRELVPIALTHLLATESFFDFEGLKDLV